MYTYIYIYTSIICFQIYVHIRACLVLELYKMMNIHICYIDAFIALLIKLNINNYV